jgi:hypothetical protein
VDELVEVVEELEVVDELEELVEGELDNSVVQLETVLVNGLVVFVMSVVHGLMVVTEEAKLHPDEVKVEVSVELGPNVVLASTGSVVHTVRVRE